MPLDFEKYAAKGNEFVKLVAEDLKMPRDKAGRIIRAVLHALRNRISHEESFQLMAQLPLALKAVYVDGWNFSKERPRINHLDEYLDEVRLEDGGLAGYDFGNNSTAKNAVAAVFKALTYYVSEGEMNDVMNHVPQELKEFLKETISGKEIVL